MGEKSLLGNEAWAMGQCKSRGNRGPQTGCPEFGRAGGQAEDRQAGRQAEWRSRATLGFCAGEAGTRQVLVGKAKITKRESASLRMCS